MTFEVIIEECKITSFGVLQPQPDVGHIIFSGPERVPMEQYVQTPNCEYHIAFTCSLSDGSATENCKDANLEDETTFVSLVNT